MGIFYEIEGSLEVHDSEETEAAIEELKGVCVGLQCDLTVQQTENKTLTLHFSLAGDCCYGTAGEIDAALEAIGRHALAAAPFPYAADGEPGVLWVGPDEAGIQAAKSRVALEQITQLVAELQLPELLNLKALIGA